MVGGPGAELRFKPWKFLTKHVERAKAIRITIDESREMRRLESGCPDQFHEDPFDAIAIDSAERADSTITIENLLAEIARITPDFVLMDAVFAAETPASPGHLAIAPST